MRPYLELIKPGIVMGNLVSVAGGIFLGARGDPDWRMSAMVAVGVSLIVASGCAVNNIVDRDIDSMMQRTRQRPMPTKRMTVIDASVAAITLGTIGAITLYRATRQLLPLLLVLIGYVVYAGIYTMALKRKSVHGTFVGSIAGATPPVAGYCAACGQFDATACVLLTMYALWQMAHSYAIAMFRADDYRTARIPVLPLVKGFATAKRQIVFYIAAFAVAALLPCMTGSANRWYGIVALFTGCTWLWIACSSFNTVDDVSWARRVFWTSILVVIVLNVAMTIAAI